MESFSLEGNSILTFRVHTVDMHACVALCVCIYYCQHDFPVTKQCLFVLCFVLYT